MLFIGEPYIAQNGDRSRLVCDIGINRRETRTVWFEVDREYEKYLCTERSDAYVIGLLSWAMRAGHDITCTMPVSEELLYALREYLIPSLVKYAPSFRAVEINAPAAGTPLANAGAVGTGLSCGIDSFHVISRQLASPYKTLNLTHLCINNVGAFNGCYGEYGIEKARRERYQISQRVAKELGLPLIATDSNFQTAFKQNHSHTHTYSSMFAVFCLQKLWGTYFYASSGYDFNFFSLDNHANEDSSHYELLSLGCFSTRGLKIYSEGGAYTRLEKTAHIAGFDYARRYLHVCTRKSTNCGKCPKCMRTLLTLDALGRLDDFREVFDVDYYRAHRKDYLLWLYKMHKKKDVMNEPTYRLLKKEMTPAVKGRYRLNVLLRRFGPFLTIDERYVKIRIFFIKISFRRKHGGAHD